MNPLRIYIAGPYCPINTTLHDASRIAQRNVDRAIEVFHKLKAKGHHPFVPHLSHYIHIHPTSLEDYGDWWYGYDLTFIYNWANALYYIAPSRGADLELSLAQKLGLDIFYSVDEVPIIVQEGSAK